MDGSEGMITAPYAYSLYKPENPAEDLSGNWIKRDISENILYHWASGFADLSSNLRPKELGVHISWPGFGYCFDTIDDVSSETFSKKVTPEASCNIIDISDGYIRQAEQIMFYLKYINKHLENPIIKHITIDREDYDRKCSDCSYGLQFYNSLKDSSYNGGDFNIYMYGAKGNYSGVNKYHEYYNLWDSGLGISGEMCGDVWPSSDLSSNPDCWADASSHWFYRDPSSIVYGGLDASNSQYVKYRDNSGTMIEVFYPKPLSNNDYSGNFFSCEFFSNINIRDPSYNKGTMGSIYRDTGPNFKPKLGPGQASGIIDAFGSWSLVSFVEFLKLANTSKDSNTGPVGIYEWNYIPLEWVTDGSGSANPGNYWQDGSGRIIDASNIHYWT